MRSPLQDRLLTRSFWLMDVAPIEALALPVLNPLFGFSTITGPEITLETVEIKEANYPFPTHVIKSGTTGNITLQRGSLFYDSDFWRWITAAAQGDTQALQSKLYGVAATLSTASAETLSSGFVGGESVSFGAALATSLGAGLFGIPRIGGPTYRRDLMLVQYFPISPVSAAISAAVFAVGGTLASESLGGAVGALTLAGVTAGRTAGLTSQGFSSSGNALLQAAQRLPAKAWMLKGCVPTRYKVGDFDASSSEVSMLELDIAVHSIEEISLAGG